MRNPILVGLISDYAKRCSNNGIQYIMIHFLAKQNSEKVSEKNRIMYNVIRRYLETNATSVTKELIWAE
jgi:hypothetical protein